MTIFYVHPISKILLIILQSYQNSKKNFKQNSLKLRNDKNIETENRHHSKWFSKTLNSIVLPFSMTTIPPTRQEFIGIPSFRV